MVWNLSAAARGYLRFYMPTNRAIDHLRSPLGRKWAIPVALVATSAYLYAMSICATIVDRGGPGYLNVLVVLFFWNAAKFAWLAVVTSFRVLLQLRRPPDAKAASPWVGRSAGTGSRSTILIAATSMVLR